jgi:hypothetical protein
MHPLLSRTKPTLRARRFAAVSATALVAVCLVPLSPALANAGSKSAMTPTALICDPAPGTVLTSKPTSLQPAEQPTSISSSFIAGPGTITRTLAATSTVTATVTASFSVNESLLFLSAKQTYGVSLAGSLAHAATWSYALNVPAGYTDKVQQFHAASVMGITQTYMGFPAQSCAVLTESTTSHNYFPSSDTSDSSYCYALTHYTSPPPQISSSCTNVY